MNLSIFILEYSKFCGGYIVSMLDVTKLTHRSSSQEFTTRILAVICLIILSVLLLLIESVTFHIYSKTRNGPGKSYCGLNDFLSEKLFIDCEVG
ncbi:UNVERIFIED_CONTAM: hypothetical protein NCL1_52855 [Trichonephila clavipes]